MRCVARERGWTLEQVIARRAEKAAASKKPTRRCKWCSKVKSRAQFINGGESFCCRTCRPIRWRAQKHGLTYDDAKAVIDRETDMKRRGLMQCTRCHKTKPRSEFLVVRSDNWRKGQCRECRSWGKQTPDERRKHLDRISRYLKKRLSIDLPFRVSQRLKSQIRQALNSSGCSKGGRTFEMLGYSPADLAAHLEAQFEPWMNWRNWGQGKGTWQIDHIKEVCTFDFADPKQIKKCWALKNLRPLCSVENNRRSEPLRKAKRIAGQQRRRAREREAQFTSRAAIAAGSQLRSTTKRGSAMHSLALSSS
jgi:hypothetical protein